MLLWKKIMYLLLKKYLLNVILLYLVNSCKIPDNENKIILNVRKAKDYIIENNILQIDLLKIDTEGDELSVLRGFEDMIK